MTKTTLLGALLLGALLGGGGAWLVLGERGDGNQAETAVRSERQPQRKKSGTPPAAAPAGLSPREAASEFGAWLGEADTEEEIARLQDLVARAAEWSPQDALEQTLQIENPYARRAVMERLFRYWIGSDEAAALEAIDTLGMVALQRHLYRDAMNWLAQSNPAAAVSLLGRSGSSHDRELWNRSFANWLRTDREAALQGVFAIKDTLLREQVLRTVAQRMADGDLTKAVKWMQSLEGQDAETARAGVLWEAANERPELVAEHLDEIADGRIRSEVIARAADEWAERDPEAALEWAGSLDELERERAIAEIAETVLDTDAERAEEIIDLLPESERRTQVLEQIARLRAAVSLENAIAWIETLHPADREGAWEGTAREWARADPRAAAEFGASVEDPVARRELVDAASYAWAQHEPAAAAEWAGTLPGASGERAMQRVVESWSRDDPAAAGEFVMNALDGDLQVSMTRQVVGRWMRNDVAEASAWIDTLPDGRARDGAIYSLVSSIEEDFPETAMQWARTITNERTRDQAERRLRRHLGE